MKKILLKAFLFFFFANLQGVFAFEDYVVISDGKLTDIYIEDNTIVDVYPLITIMNDKNTLIFHPLKEGKTKVSVLKNKKNKVEFDVQIENGFTKIEHVQGFDIYSLDEPPITDYSLQIDLPPSLPLVFPPAIRGKS